MIEAVLVKGEPNSQRKACIDCKHCQAALHWWCTNPHAAEARGTHIPGTENCQFWEPVKRWKDLKWYDKIFPSYIKIKQT